MRPGSPFLPKALCIWFCVLLGVVPAGAAEPPDQLGTVWVQVSGNNQRVQPGATFFLQVRLGEPAHGVHIGVGNIETSGPTISCDNDLTDGAGFAQIDCIAGAWPIETTVRITLIDIFGRTAPTFNITVAPFTLLEGLTQPAGPRATVARGMDFELGVQAVRNGAPQLDLELIVERMPIAAPVSCPEVAFTDISGQTRIICESLLPLEENTTVLITVTDPFGRSVTFTVFLLARDEFLNGVFKVSGDNQVVSENGVLAAPLVALTIRNDQPAENVRVTVSVTDPTILMCPGSALSGDDGRVRIFCSVGPILQNGSVRVFLRDEQLGVSIDEAFGIAITSERFGVAATLNLLSAPRISAKAGETIDRAVRIEALDGAGAAVRGVPLFFHSNQNITFDPTVAVTNLRGHGETSITIGCPGGDGLIRVAPQANATLIRIPVEVDTGGPTHLLRLQGNRQSGAPNERLEDFALVVRLTDRCFNPLRSERVTWLVDPPDAATLENVLGTTGFSGRSSVLVRLGARPGRLTVTATHRELSQTFELEVIPTPAGLRATEISQRSVPRGQLSEPLEVQLVSGQGEPIPGASIVFALESGSGSLSSVVSTTDAEGRASTRFLAGDELGPAVIAARLGEASVAELTSKIGQVEQGQLVAEFTLNVGGRFPRAPLAGFVDGASFRGGWVPGGLASIFGEGLVETVGVSTGSSALFPTQLEGVSVRIDGNPAPLLSVSNTAGAEQINLQPPFELGAPASVTVAINNNGSESVFEGVQLFRVRPGVFEINIQGGRFAAALHSDFRLIAPADPARPGETVLLFLTGMGQTNPAVATNEAGPIPAPQAQPALVTLDGRAVTNFGVYYAPGLVTVYQINFTVPDDIRSGELELRVTTDGVTSSPVFLPVRR